MMVQVIILIGKTKPNPSQNTDMKTSVLSPENYYYAYQSYLNLLERCKLVAPIILHNESKEPVTKYQLTPFGKMLALISKYQSGDTDKNLYDEIFHSWSIIFDIPPISSLDTFSKKYFHDCKESDIFEEFVKEFCEYLLSNPIIYNEIDLFTQMVLHRSTNNETNRKLWKIWEKTYQQIDTKSQDLFLFQIKLYMNRIIAIKVTSLSDYEDAVYEIRANHKMVVIEYRCNNCSSNFCMYKSVNILTYLSYLFNDITDIQYYDVNGVIRCSFCNGKLSIINLS